MSESKISVEQNWALEGGFVDVQGGRLDDELIALAHLRRDAIPRKTISHEILGRVTAEAAAETGLVSGTPVVGGAADFIASALAAGVVQGGQVLLKFGVAPGSVVVCVLTGHGLKDPDLAISSVKVPVTIDANMESVLSVLG